MAERHWIEQGMLGPIAVGTTAAEGLGPNLVFLDPQPSSKVAALVVVKYGSRSKGS